MKEFFILAIAALFLLGCNFNRNNSTHKTDTKNEINDTSGKVIATISTEDNPIDLSQKFTPINKLNELEPDKLYILENEIYARHGYQFSIERYKNYFAKYEWYTPTEERYGDIMKKLTEVDKYNLEYIRNTRYQKSFNILPLYKLDTQNSISYEEFLDTSILLKDTLDIKIRGKEVDFVRTKNLDKYIAENKEGTTTEYHLKLISLDTNHKFLDTEVKGISANLSNIEIIAGNSLVCKINNFKCCGGPDITSLYSLKHDKFFLQANYDLFVHGEDENANIYWFGYVFDLWREWKDFDEKKMLKDGQFKGFTYTGSFVQATEEKLMEVFDIFLRNDVFDSLQLTKNLEQISIKLAPQSPVDVIEVILGFPGATLNFLFNGGIYEYAPFPDDVMIKRITTNDKT